jgi:uncharacterized protein (TIGR03067 family)
MPALQAPLLVDPAYEVEKKLQGSWVVVSGRWRCRLCFAGHHFAVRFQNGDVYMGLYTVDPTRRPGGMDMTVEEGPEHLEHLLGRTAFCLYELDGDTLRWCGNEPGSPERPSHFPADGEGNYPTLVLRREGL